MSSTDKQFYLVGNHSKSYNVKIKPDNSGGGGSDMTEYATKQELKNTETKINGKIDTLEANLNGRFNVIDEKFNTQNSKFDTQNSKLDNLNSTIKWVGGILSAIIGAILVKFLLG